MINSFQGKHRWLSNFWYCVIFFDGERYNSVEAAYVAGKTTDSKIRAQIRNIPTPGKMKRFGRTFKIRDDWEIVKVPLMENFLRQKFAKGSLLGNKLVATEKQELIEGNTWGDMFWGVCHGVGENTLGRLLMQIRSEIS